MPLLEIACFSAESAIIAQASGASRVELCKDQSLGGITPLLSTFKSLRDVLAIPIYVMIRPNGRNFTYTSSEYETMEQDILTFKREGAHGFVFGILDDDGDVDKERCKGLVNRADGRPCTFHRAFDEIPESKIPGQLEVLIECGFSAVLTSGGKNNSVEGKEALRNLVTAASGRIDVIVGGGVRSSNLEVLRTGISARVFHSSAIVNGGETANREEIKLLKRLLNE